MERHCFCEGRARNCQDSSASTPSFAGFGWGWSLTALPSERFQRGATTFDRHFIEGTKSIPELLLSILENVLHGLCRHIGSPIDPVKFHLILAFIHLGVNLGSHDKEFICNFFLSLVLPFFELLGLLVVDFEFISDVFEHNFELITMRLLNLRSFPLPG